MKKMIIKTIAFSLAILLAVAIFFYLGLAWLSPSTLSNLYFRIDAKELTLKYSEKAYERSGDVETLSILVERSIAFKDSDRIIEHATDLINREDYEEYSTNQGNGYHYYVISSLCSYLYESGERQTSVGTAISHTGDYTKLNPIRVVISLCMQNNDVENLKLIKNSLIGRENKNQLVINDVSLIGDFLKE